MTSAGSIIGTAGRMGRLAYLGWTVGVAVLVAALVLLALALAVRGGVVAMLGWTLLGVAGLIFALGMLVAQARRLHDLGLSAWHLLWLLPLQFVAQYHAQWGGGGDQARFIAALLAIGLHAWLMLAPGQILLADRAYDSNALRDAVEARGTWANIKPLSRRLDPPAFSPYLYRYRNLIERFFNKIKNYRAIATRYDKRATYYLAAVKLAVIRIWLRHNESVT